MMGDRVAQEMIAQPIKFATDSDLIVPAPVPPLISSDAAPWDGLRLEYHLVPKGEFPDRVAFDRHVIVAHAGTQPFRKYWRSSGREHQVDVAPGDVALVSHQDIYGCRWTGAHRLVVIGINDDRLDEVFADELSGHNAEFAIIPSASDPILNRMLLSLKGEAELGGPGGRLYADSVLTALSGYALTRYGTIQARLRTYRRGLSTPALKRVLDAIHSRLGEDIGVRELAAIAGLSTYHFGKLFRQSTGRTVYQYVLDQRMFRACELLRRQQLNLASIGAQVGFSNPAHFSTAFRKRIGASPRAYQRSFASA